MRDRPTLSSPHRLADALLPAVLDAGRAILAARAEGLVVERKADASPVTAADRRAEAIILDALAEIEPEIPVVAEESVAGGHLPSGLDDAGAGDFFLVDALDGTKDFLRGGPDFTVNIGLVRAGVPVFGIVHAPATGHFWVGIEGEGAFSVSREEPGVRHRIKVRRPGADGLDIVASLSHRTAETDAFIARFPGARVVAAGSSRKFCALAEGIADLYPRLGDTSQWDTAAGDAVLRAAGGRTLTLDGQPLRYGPRLGHGQAGFLNPWFVATAGLDPFA